MEIFHKAQDLPDDWEYNIGDNLYLKKDYLNIAEKMDASQKTYYLFRDNNGFIDTQFLICKTADNNIAMFTPFNIPVLMNSVYYPFTLSKPAGIFGVGTKLQTENFLKSLKGFTMILNVDKDYVLEGFSKGLILPKCILKISWNTFDDYISELRSGYRRRYNIAFRKSENLNCFILQNNMDFNEEMYNLYLDVYNNAEYKLGKVSIDYFREKRCIIIVLKNDKGVQGFAQLSKNCDELIFEFVGLNKKNVMKYDTYIRLLLEIVRYGIEQGFSTIDLGQTTDEAKLKLGSRYKMLYVLIRHSNPVINKILKLVTPLLEYKPLNENQFHVFKKIKKEG
ncbi:MAG: hypothetical protein KHX03_05000 [Clostridium sp.]|nr:hypothetical protein [Clostridium sp.]